MNVLVVNLGSTSFKFRLFDMADERELAGGGERVADRGGAGHAAAIARCLPALLRQFAVDAIGFKAVHGGPLSGAVPVTAAVLAAMDEFAAAAPAHNPIYTAAMRAFRQQLPGTPQVAAFETGFHRTIPAARTTYAVPAAWTAAGVRRYGFHGASHRGVAERVAAACGPGRRIVSCHLGGSSSVCAIAAGASVYCSFGMTPQSGLPQNNRLGDFDAYALLVLMQRTGRAAEDLLAEAAREGGLLGISGTSGDMKELLERAAAGDERAALAVDVFVESARHHLGAGVVALGGLDVLAFTGGIGCGSAAVRARICSGLGWLGVELDAASNAKGGDGALVSRPDAPVEVLVLPTDEERVVARQVRDVIGSAAEPARGGPAASGIQR
jgi:acetate kinase